MVHDGISKRAWVFVAAAGLIVIALTMGDVSNALPRGEDKQPHTAGSVQGAQGDHRGSEQRPLVVTLAQSPKSENESANVAKANQNKAENNGRLFWVTCALAAVAFLQWVIMLRQTHHIGRSVKVAERALTELERPYLFLEIVRPGFTKLAMPKGFSYDIQTAGTQYRFINHGRTPAILREIMDRVDVVTSLLPPPIDPKIDLGRELPYGVVVPVGKKSKVFDAQCHPAQLFIKPADALMADDHYFVLMGHVTYEDVFGDKHITGYATLFSEIEQTFVLMGGKDYNYTKRLDRPTNHWWSRLWNRRP